MGYVSSIDRLGLLGSERSQEAHVGNVSTSKAEARLISEKSNLAKLRPVDFTDLCSNPDAVEIFGIKEVFPGLFQVEFSKDVLEIFSVNEGDDIPLREQYEVLMNQISAIHAASMSKWGPITSMQSRIELESTLYAHNLAVEGTRLFAYFFNGIAIGGLNASFTLDPETSLSIIFRSIKDVIKLKDDASPAAKFSYQIGLSNMMNITSANLSKTVDTGKLIINGDQIFVMDEEIKKQIGTLMRGDIASYVKSLIEHVRNNSLDSNPIIRDIANAIVDIDFNNLTPQYQQYYLSNAITLLVTRLSFQQTECNARQKLRLGDDVKSVIRFWTASFDGGNMASIFKLMSDLSQFTDNKSFIGGLYRNFIRFNNRSFKVFPNEAIKNSIHKFAINVHTFWSGPIIQDRFNGELHTIAPERSDILIGEIPLNSGKDGEASLHQLLNSPQRYMALRFGDPLHFRLWHQLESELDIES